MSIYNQQIETFISVAKYGSFSKAAEELFISTTAVMKQINSLEEHLAFKLFIRSNQGLVLTEAGKSLLDDAKYLVDYSNKSINKAKEISSKEDRQSIRVGTSIMTPAKFLLDVWSEVQKVSENLKIELVPFDNTPENAREILKNLGRHIDVVAGIYDDKFLKERECQAAHLDDKRIFLAVPLSHPLCNKEVITMDDLKEHEIMLITKGWKVVHQMRDDFANSNIKIIDFDFYNLNAFNKAVSDNVPIMAIDGWENVHPLLKIIPVEWKYTIPFGIMYSLNPTQSVLNFIKILKKVI